MTTTLRHGCVLLVLLGACADDSDEDGDRGPIRSADLDGSCAGTECDGPAPSGNCFCDDNCTRYGDCCDDFVEVCEAPTAASCGGFAGLVCDEGTYCHFALDLRCGAGDQLGTCVAQPDACTGISAPVCGCDGQTYDNSCLAARAGTGVASEAACASAASTTWSLRTPAAAGDPLAAGGGLVGALPRSY